MMASDTITRSWVRTSASFTARLGFVIRGQKAQNVLFQLFNAGTFSRHGLLGALLEYTFPILWWQWFPPPPVHGNYIIAPFIHTALGAIKMWHARQDSRKIESFTVLPLSQHIFVFPPSYYVKRGLGKLNKNQNNSNTIQNTSAEWSTQN